MGQIKNKSDPVSVYLNMKINKKSKKKNNNNIVIYLPSWAKLNDVAHKDLHTLIFLFPDIFV